MNKYAIRLCAWLAALLLAAALLPGRVSAAGRIRPDEPASLTVSYKDGETAVSGAAFALYHVADVDEYGRMTLTAPFAGYETAVTGLADLNRLTQDGWAALAATLRGLALKDGLAPDASGKTDSEGSLTFGGLSVGLYLVTGTPLAAENGYTYTPVPFLTFLPAEDMVRNVWEYDVHVALKSTKEKTPPEEERISRKVLKIWDDDGNEAARPREITVHLLCDGELFDTQTLNEGSSWRHVWEDLPAASAWEVVEEPVEGYTALVTESGITFTVTNTYETPADGTNLSIRKRVTGDKPRSDSTFTFCFTALDEANPMPQGSTGRVKEVSVTGAGTCRIGSIPFEKPGTYGYTVSEKNLGVKGYTYDITLYTVTFTVSETEDGELSITKTIKDNTGKAASALVFNNPYTEHDTKIPQTGVLWWPVPLLLLAGCVCLTVGLLRRKRGER